MHSLGINGKVEVRWQTS